MVVYINIREVTQIGASFSDGYLSGVNDLHTKIIYALQ
jgi:hypothetical protein